MHDDKVSTFIFYVYLLEFCPLRGIPASRGILARVRLDRLCLGHLF